MIQKEYSSFIKRDNSCQNKTKKNKNNKNEIRIEDN